MTILKIAATVCWRLTQKTTKESHKSIQFGTHVPWVILKHPRRGAQNFLKQEVSYLLI